MKYFVHTLILSLSKDEPLYSWFDGLTTSDALYSSRTGSSFGESSCTMRSAVRYAHAAIMNTVT